MPERYVDYNKGRVPVQLPSDLQSAESDRNIDKETTAIVTLTADGRVHLGTDHSPLERPDLTAKIRPLLESKSEEDRIVYLAADVAADYGHVVAACDEIRKIDSALVGLLVNRRGDDWPRRLTVELPKEPDPNEDISNLKPNPLTLVVTINPDQIVTLNQDPMGSISDLSALSRKLHEIFQLRLENRAYKSGLETATDMPESERIEKTLTIKAPKHIKYGEVVKVIDVARGAGARPIVLQLDDLPN
jgi:biopolymer transport protein ExbD